MDKGSCEFIGPRGATNFLQSISTMVIRTQTGYIAHYLCIMVIFCLLVGYFGDLMGVFNHQSFFDIGSSNVNMGKPIEIS